MADVTFNNAATDGDLGNPANWDAGLPTGRDNAIIAVSPSVGSVSAGDITIMADATGNVSYSTPGTISLDGVGSLSYGEFCAGAGISNVDGSGITFDGVTFNSPYTSSQADVFNSGTFNGIVTTGIGTIINGGTFVSDIVSQGYLTINDISASGGGTYYVGEGDVISDGHFYNLTDTSGGTYSPSSSINVAGTITMNSDSITITGAAVVAFNVNLSGPFASDPYGSFEATGSLTVSGSVAGIRFITDDGVSAVFTNTAIENEPTFNGNTLFIDSTVYDGIFNAPVIFTGSSAPAGYNTFNDTVTFNDACIMSMSATQSFTGPVIIQGTVIAVALTQATTIGFTSSSTITVAANSTLIMYDLSQAAGLGQGIYTVEGTPIYLTDETSRALLFNVNMLGQLFLDDSSPPAESTVLAGVMYDASQVGTYVTLSPGDVRLGTAFGPGNSLTGTLNPMSGAHRPRLGGAARHAALVEAGRHRRHKPVGV